MSPNRICNRIQTDFFDTKSERNNKRQEQEQERNKDKNKNKNKNRDTNKNKNKNKNKNTNNRTRTKHEPETNYKEKELDRIELVSRAEALISDDVILTRSRSLDTSYRVLNDATSSKGR